MESNRNIKVKLFTGKKNRITLSNGCVKVEKLQGINCREATFVPKEPWLEINSDCYKSLKRKGVMKKNDVAIIKLPKNVIKDLKNLGLERCINFKDIEFIQNTNNYQIAQNKLDIFLSKINTDLKVPIEKHNIFFGKSNLKNTTYNSKEKVYIGMHLDSWENENLSERHLSRNRICINLGQDKRFLMFYNISIQQMAKMIGKDIDSNKFEINSIFTEFAILYPETEIYRIEIRPYEAYIAPTEFIIHDGSSINNAYFDVNLVFRGHFLVKNNFISKLAMKLNLTK